MPSKPTPTATLVTRETIVELTNHPEAVPAGDAQRGPGQPFVPTHLTISTDYSGRPARLLSVSVTAHDTRGHMGRWASSTRDPLFRLRAIPESLRSLVCAFEPSLVEWVEYRPLEDQ